jgi:hypothetical protein
LRINAETSNSSGPITTKNQITSQKEQEKTNTESKEETWETLSEPEKSKLKEVLYIQQEQKK